MVVCRPLIKVVSLVVKHGTYVRGFQYLKHVGSVVVARGF